MITKAKHFDHKSICKQYQQVLATPTCPEPTGNKTVSADIIRSGNYNYFSILESVSMKLPRITAVVAMRAQISLCYLQSVRMRHQNDRFVTISRFKFANSSQL